jgi:hypothetical protein
VLAFPTVTQGTPQLSDVEAKAALVDGQVGPSSGHKLAFCDNFARAADQKAQKVECTTAKWDR